MTQSGVVLAALGVAFLIFITVRGELTSYMQVLL